MRILLKEKDTNFKSKNASPYLDKASCLVVATGFISLRRKEMGHDGKICE